MKVLQFVTESLGDSSYLVVAGSEAAVIDPQRDVRPYLAAARAEGVTITHVFETHVHNDYLSGGPELAALGAKIIAPAGAHLEFPHTPVADGEEIAIGNVRIRAMAAPGHTYEHTAYLAIDDAGDLRGVFTGGAVLVGSAGRSDLLGPEHTETLTRLQWETAQRIRAIAPPTAEVLPTHGAGSFCSVSGGTERRAMMAVELERNPAFVSASYESFRAIHLASAAPIPGYYRYMAPINRSGADVRGEPPKPALLDVAGLTALDAAGIRIIDVRSRHDYVKGHVPFALGMEESGSLLAYVGWTIPFAAPLGLVTDDADQAERVTVDLFRVGYDDVRGHLPFQAWIDAEEPVAGVARIDAGEAAEILATGRMPLIDVRYANEQAELPLPGALELPIDRIEEWAPTIPAGPVAVSCASGQRSVIAASLLAKLGHEVRVVSDGGAAEIRRALGRHRSA